MTARWRALVAQWRSGLAAVFRRSPADASHERGWVIPENAVTRAVYAGLEHEDPLQLAQRLYLPWQEPRELAPENVVIAAPPPRPEADAPVAAEAPAAEPPSKDREGHAA